MMKMINASTNVSRGGRPTFFSKIEEIFLAKMPHGAIYAADGWSFSCHLTKLAI
jgi:hypothetical protein